MKVQSGVKIYKSIHFMMFVLTVFKNKVTEEVLRTFGGAAVLGIKLRRALHLLGEPSSTELHAMPKEVLITARINKTEGQAQVKFALKAET